MAELSLEAIDRLLEAWNVRLARVDESLLLLDGDPTYRLCEGRLGRLEGRTREALLPVLSEVRRLFADRERLGAVVERARAVRASMSPLTFWDNDERRDELEALLLGPSVVTDVDQAPLAERSLLDDAARDVRETPDAVLSRMIADFQRARDVLAVVARAWTKLEPALAEARERARQIGAAAKGEGVVGEKVEAIERALRAAEEVVASDPLGAEDGFRRDVEARLAALGAEVDAIAAQRARLASNLSRARELLAEAERAHADARAALDAAARRIALGPGALGLFADDDAVSGLAPWLARLALAVTEEHFGAVEVGLARFFTAAEGFLARDRAAAARVAALGSKRDELVGRVSARRAQLEARVARGEAVDAGAHELLGEAERVLRMTPLPLGDATVAVEAFEAALRR